MGSAQKIVDLWRLLDDIDTLDDACKGNDALFRRSAYDMQRRRFDIVSGEEFDEFVKLADGGECDACLPSFYSALSPVVAAPVEADDLGVVAWRWKKVGYGGYRYSSDKDEADHAEDVRTVEPLYSADRIDTLEREKRLLAGKLSMAERDLATLTAERDGLSDELEEKSFEPWPEWAEKVLKEIRKRSGYDGYDDADGVDLPAELDEAFCELEREADRHIHEVRADREVELHKSSADHYRLKVTELCSKLETAEARIAELEAALSKMLTQFDCDEGRDFTNEADFDAVSSARSALSKSEPVKG